MTQWWTYTLTDFLMFSPHVYYRLFEIENQRLWPYQLVVPLGCAVTNGLALCNARRSAIALSAMAWLVCAWKYFKLGYSTIHTLGDAFAIVFGAQAAAMFVYSAAGARGALSNRFAHRAGTVTIMLAVFLQPLIGQAAGRPLAQTEVVAFMPDPTVLATLGVFTVVGGVSTWLLLVPLAWSLYSCATLYAMRSAYAVLPLAHAALILTLGVLQKSRPRAVAQLQE